MRRACELTPTRARLGLALVVVACAAGCAGADAEATVLLLRDEAATFSGVSALYVEVAEEGQTPEAFGPFEIDAAEGETLNALVTPGTPFFVDVLGCAAVDACDRADSIAHGCSTIEQLASGTTDNIVRVVMHDAAVGHALCPPAFP